MKWTWLEGTKVEHNGYICNFDSDNSDSTYTLFMNICELKSSKMSHISLACPAGMHASFGVMQYLVQVASLGTRQGKVFGQICGFCRISDCYNKALLL